MANLAVLAATDPSFIHIRAFDLPSQEPVIAEEGIVQPAELLANGSYDQTSSIVNA